MSWVRYDDGFDSHPKVTGVVFEDPGAIALHTLANTWSSRQKRPGFVPTHQAGVLVGKARGKRWAALLEKHGLWDAVEGGWEFHDHGEYRESGKRSTAGTPADLSEKRREAGRKGGKAAQQRRANAKQPPQQNEQDARQANADAVSPVLEPSYEASRPEPVPTTSAVARIEQADGDAGAIVKAYCDGATSAGHPRPGQPLRGKVGRDAKRLLNVEQVPFTALSSAAFRMGQRGWDSLDRELQRASVDAAPRGSSNMQDHADFIRQLEQGESA